jgi:hypothetical protein
MGAQLLNRRTPPPSPNPPPPPLPPSSTARFARTPLTPLPRAQVGELKSQAGADADTQKKTEAQLKKVDKDIETAKAKLKDVVQPNFEAAKKTLSEVTAQKDNTFEQIKGIYAKQGRGTEFTTEKERDAYVAARAPTSERAKQAPRKRRKLARSASAPTSERAKQAPRKRRKLARSASAGKN